MKKINNFFVWCSGASVEIVNMCDDKEKTKYANIGIVVFAVALLSTLSSTFFLSFAFDTTGNDFNFLYLPVGLIWGFIILSLDRAIVSTISKNDSWYVQIFKSIPRFILSLTIGIILATPLEFKIFEKEINNIIDNNVLEIVKHDKSDKFKNELKLLEDNFKESETYYLLNKKMYSDEVDGKKSGIPGKGARANEYMNNELKSLNKLNTARDTLEKFKEKLINLEKQIDFDKETKEYKDVNIGILDRVEVLYSIGYLHTIISFLFILIEILPLLIKLLSTKGSYDEIYLSQQQLKIAESKSNLELIIKKINNEHENFDNNSKLLQEELQSQHQNKLKLNDVNFQYNLKIKQEEEENNFKYKKTKLDKIQNERMSKLNEKTINKKEIKRPKQVIYNKTWFLNDKINYVFKKSNNVLYIYNDGKIDNGTWSLIDDILTLNIHNTSEIYKLISLNKTELILNKGKKKIILKSNI